MAKIKVIIIEPTTVYTNSSFKLKIKVQRGLTFQELKDNMTFTTVKSYDFGELKGD